MSNPDDSGSHRTLGLFGATAVGVGAIVGGGVLALAGVAFATTGPSAIVAFAANGLIAVLTALSFAEMAARFPESGGTYAFAKKVLKVETAFMVGWVVWLASIVAAVLYALGFAAFALPVLERLTSALFGAPAAWLGHDLAPVALALAATAFYAVELLRRSAGGGQWATIGKVVVFAVLILGGAWAFLAGGPVDAGARLRPFFPHGGLGLLQAMGYTFIALQGFDLIAAVGGEVKQPGRTIPRAMLLSLAIALAIYLPLLFIVATLGVPEGGTITELAAQHPETVVALAAEHYLGPAGLWLVLVAGLLSMLSALQANLFAASRVALAMGRDRTLPATWGQLDPRYGTPRTAVLATALTVVVIVVILPDVAAAGAVSSLIFLLTFALAHWTGYLARRRSAGAPLAFRLPLFPLIPASGGLACLALAVFQGFAVPAAGVLAAVWLALGGLLYVSFFAPRARVHDAFAEARDPDLLRLRGRRPRILVPVANPARAEALVEVANALSPTGVGEVLLLSVVRPPEVWRPGEPLPQVADAQAILEKALTLSLATNRAPEALTTIATDPVAEIARVARAFACESLLLGFGQLTAEGVEGHVEALLAAVDADVVVLRAPQGWRLSQVRRVLVPAGGRRDQSDLRARLLATLARTGVGDVTYLRVFPLDAPAERLARARRELEAQAQDEAARGARIELVTAGDVAGAVVERAEDCDLVILGLRRLARRRRVFGDLVLDLARRTDCGLLLIARRG
ncbi:MAG: amino acid permease [Acidobacteria bacterium]|nr:MAG: amino acid permease [Acidobacteriota bacterium]